MGTMKAWGNLIGAMLGGYALATWLPYPAQVKHDDMVPYSERSEYLSFARSMVCRGVAEGSVGALPAKKKVSVTSGAGSDIASVKITDTGVNILTQASVSVGVAESSPMPIVVETESLIFAVEVGKGWSPYADVFSLNKKTGVAVYSSVKSMGAMGLVDGMGMVELMECR